MKIDYAEPITSIKPEKDAHWLSLVALGMYFGALIAIGMEWL